jgi:hypothetical protein
MTSESVLAAAGRLAISLVAGATIALSDARLPDLPLHARGDAFVPDPATVRAGAFGFHAALADFFWLRAIQIVGGDGGASGQSHTIGGLIDVVTTLNPQVDHPYRFAAIWMTDDAVAVRHANQLLERGIENHPDDWRHYFYLGFNHFFYLDDQEAAAKALAPAIALDGAPPYLGRLAARLRSRSGGLDAAHAFLTELHRTTTDERERKHYALGLKEIETERQARFLDAARAEYVRRHKRDIERVEDLVTGRVLRSLPSNPFETPWELDEETREIVAAGVGYRYRVKLDPAKHMDITKFRDPSK